jgi:4-amino-4-deoxy-L-arabinose transferase-like glycosyltransferase
MSKWKFNFRNKAEPIKTVPDQPSPAPKPPALKLQYELVVLFIIILTFILLGWNSLKQESVTIDEFAHLPAGLSYLRETDFRLYPHSPPLVRMIAALPLVWSKVVLPLKSGWTDGNQYEMGEEFMRENARSYQAIFVRARMMILFLGVILIALSWWWARSLYGSWSGLMAATLTGFCPNIMAHSGLVTTDLGTALAFLSSVFSFWLYCRKPSIFRMGAAGIMLGITLLCKFTSLIMIPILICLGAGYFYLGPKTQSWKKWIRDFILLLLFSWITLNTGYFWKGFGTTLDKYHFVSRQVPSLTSFLPAQTPIPLPFDYVRGFDLQSRENDAHYSAYLFGKISLVGWRYYYLVAMAVKMTIGSLGLVLAGMFSLGFGRRVWRDELFVLIPPLGVIGAISLLTQINLGLRYILPALPFFYILSSRLAPSLFHAKTWLRALALILLASHIFSNFLIYPHYLSYFNLAAGGPKNGYKILVDSNLDWGQDLIHLKEYMDQNKLDRICLVYFGNADPGIYGIQYRLPYRGEQCDQLAASQNFLAGIPSFLRDHTFFLVVPQDTFSWLKNERPIGLVGYSIKIFDLKNNDSFQKGIYGPNQECPIKN